MKTFLVAIAMMIVVLASPGELSAEEVGATELCWDASNKAGGAPIFWILEDPDGEFGACHVVAPGGKLIEKHLLSRTEKQDLIRDIIRNHLNEKRIPVWRWHAEQSLA